MTPHQHKNSAAARQLRVPSDIFSRRLLIVFGKGGVGRTTVAAALALAGARAGRRTLAVELDPKGTLSRSLGIEPAFTPQPVGPGCAAMVLEGDHALREYLRLVFPRTLVLEAIFASRLYRHFVAAAPGLRELIMMGKFYHEIRELPVAEQNWDMIVLDAPASGQALGLLSMPFSAADFFSASIVGREARNIVEMLRAPELTMVVQVTTPDSLALSETTETWAGLSRLGLAPGIVILNRYLALGFRHSDVRQLMELGKGWSEPRAVELAAAAARRALKRASSSRAAERALRKALPAPVFRLPERAPLSGLELVESLADCFYPRSTEPGDERGDLRHATVRK